ncbi:MAG TPA: alpha/beta fold hydrolase, partial [Thermomicrobiales bacterium]
MRLLPEDEVTLRRITGLAIAPDGDAVVYAVSEVDLLNNRRTTRLWRCASENGTPCLLTTGGMTERFPEWSPDGASIAFVTSGPGGDRLMAAPSSGGRPNELLGPAEGFIPCTIFAGRPGGGPSYAWSPDSRSIACLVRDGAAMPGELGVEGPRATGDPAVAKEITERLRGGPRVALCVLDVASQERVTLGHAERPLDHLIWSLDGGCVYAVARAETDTAGLSHFTLLRFAQSASEPAVVMEFSGAAFAPALSPDGQQFAVSAARGTSNAPAPCLLLVAADGSAQRELSTDDLTTYATLFWLADGATLLALAESGVRRRMIRIDTRTHEAAPMGAGEVHFGERAGTPWIEMMQVAANGAAAAFSASALDHPGDFFIQSRWDAPARRLSAINPHLPSVALGEGRAIQWRGHDGATIEGILILPPGSEPGKPMPLIIDYHGGPASHVTLGWNGMRQVFAMAGYAVFAPNFRGGTGYGAASGEALRGDIGGVPFTDSMTGVDYLIAEGIVDPDRLFAYGHSWGGYMTNWTATHSDRFRAIVSSGSICDLVSVYHTRYAADVWKWRLLGTPDESPEQYLMWSP